MTFGLSFSTEKKGILEEVHDEVDDDDEDEDDDEEVEVGIEEAEKDYFSNRRKMRMDGTRFMEDKGFEKKHFKRGFDL